ncbi:MAG: RND family efflux transporter MFP subunit [Halioglobus sp.]|jgi:RND family efflux transporter MFP subunit
MTTGWQRNGLWTLAVLLLGGGLSYFLLVGKPAPEPKGLPLISQPNVDVIVVAPEKHSISVETQGTVRPNREINLISQVAGRVESVSNLFEAGEFFVAGEELLRLEGVDYRFAIARAESQVAAAKQKVAEEKGRTLQAAREWRDLGSVQANDLFLRKPQLASAEAALKAAEADLGSAELDLARTSIKVPFNGRISEKYVDLGQYVAPGTAIAKVYDTDLALVRLPLTDRQIALLDLPLNYDNRQAADQVGAQVRLRVKFANQYWEWPGRIVRTDAKIDINSRAVYAVAEVERPFARVEGSNRPPLAPGLFVNATISGKGLEGVAILPRAALRSDGTVMLVDPSSRVQKRDVHLLHSSAEKAWVQGLVTGDRVIIRESALTVAGMQVSVNNVTQVAGGDH